MQQRWQQVGLSRQRGDCEIAGDGQPAQWRLRRGVERRSCMQAHERAFALGKQPCVDAGVVHAVILARAKKKTAVPEDGRFITL